MRDTNRIAEMETFLAVLEEGSFSGAALRRRMSPSAVSKTMTRLEARLGAALIRRTTRKVSITEEGARFAHAARNILSALEQAEREAGCGPVAGIVRIATSAAYANHVLAPVLPALLRAHPDIDLEILIGDGVTNLSGQPVDIAVRAGPLPDSSLRSRSLGGTETLELRSPDGLDAEIGFLHARLDPLWKRDRPRLRVNDGNTIAILAAKGCGTTRATRFVVADLLADGRLERVPGSDVGYEEFNIVYLGTSKTMPARLTAIIDYLAEHGRVDRA